MSTNLPKSRNRNLPPPAQPAEVQQRRPVMTPVQQAPEEPEPGRGIMRPVLAMLLIAGLLFTGIHFYIRGAEADTRKRDQAIEVLTKIGRGLWEGKGLTLTSPFVTESEDLEKDFADLPRIFQAASKKGKHSVRIIEGDPSPPGRGNGTHQIQYVFNDMVNIILHVIFDDKNGRILFVGVDNRVVPARSLTNPEEAPVSAAPATPPAPSSGLPATPPALPPAGSPPAPGEKYQNHPQIRANYRVPAPFCDPLFHP